MRSIFLMFSFLLFANVHAQEKKNYANTESLLMAMQPANSVSSWMVISNVDGVDNIVYSTKTIDNYAKQESGFHLNNNSEQYFYIVYISAGNTNYIRDLASLKSFVGNVDNAEEAGIIAITEGYFLDLEFHHLAGNYIINKENYIVELGKITSNSCPLSKSHFELTISKSGSLISVKDNGVYNEVFDKDCENNPHYSKLQQQIDEAKAKKEQEAIENKEAKAKAKKKLMKSMRRR